jgi:hypothetical protein
METTDHRIPTDLSQCERVLTKLSSLGITKFFLTYERTCQDYPDDFFRANPGFPSLTDVATKLQQGEYGCPDDFYWEVWHIFNTFAAFHKDRETRVARLFWALAEEVVISFMKYCEKETMTDIERHLRKLKQIQRETVNITKYPFHGGFSRACETSSGRSFDPYDIPDKVDPIMYYEV